MITLFKIYSNAIALISLVILTVSIKTASAQSRDSLEVVSSGGNAVVILSASPAAGVTYTLSRSLTDSLNSYSPVGTFRRVANMAEFKRTAGDTLVKYLEKYKKIQSDLLLWQYIAANPELKNYGLANLKTGFLKAMGCIITDAGIKQQPSGKKVYYKVSIPGKGDIITGYRVNENAITKQPTLYQTIANDSVVYIKWGYLIAPKERTPFSAAVYKKNEKGFFVRLAERVSVAKNNDTLEFKFVQHVKANNSLTYYIQPYDIFNNIAGKASDTVTLVSADPDRLPMLREVKAKATDNGILLTWKKLVPNYYTAGIRIERTLDINGQYTVAATVDFRDTSFLDDQILQGKAYNYRLKVVGTLPSQANQNNYSGSAAASYTNKQGRPDAPYDLTASMQPNGTKLTWRRVSNAALLGYYVYRTSRADTTQMQQISRIVNDTTYTDTSKIASKRTNYTYTVKAINIAGNKSMYSNTVQSRLASGIDGPITPIYITAANKDGGVYLQWQDVKQDDIYDNGYVLYKRKKQAGEHLTYDTKKDATAEAARLGFVRVTPALIKHPYYQDAGANNSGYEYAVAAVDIVGNESGLSALTAPPDVTKIINAPIKLVLRDANKKVELNWLQANLTDISGYTIYRKIVGDKDFKKIATVSAPNTSFTDKSVESQKVYVYMVKAVGHDIESEGNASGMLKLN